MIITTNNKNSLRKQIIDRNKKFEEYNKNLLDNLTYEDNGLIESFDPNKGNMFEGFKDDFKPPQDNNFNDYEKRIMDVMNGVGKYPTTEECNNQYKVQKEQNDYIQQPINKNNIDVMIDNLVDDVGQFDRTIYQQEQIENDDIKSYYDQELSNFKTYLDNTKHSFEFFK